MSEPKKLSENRMEHIRAVRELNHFITTDPESLAQLADELVSHIEALQGEFDALVESSDNLFDEKDKRIDELEKTILKVIYGVRGIDLACEKWVCGVLSNALPGYDKIEIHDAEPKANRPGVEPER